MRCLNAMREEQTHPTLLVSGLTAVGAGKPFAESSRSWRVATRFVEFCWLSRCQERFLALLAAFGADCWRLSTKGVDDDLREGTDDERVGQSSCDDRWT